MHFRVVVPTAVKPGQMLRIRCPDGTEGDVQVPRGLKEGDSFIFEMTVPNESRVREAQRAYDEAMDRAQGCGGGSSGGGGGGSRRRHGGSGGGAGAASANAGASVSGGAGGGAVTSYGFFDREILDSRDFLTALAVGMIIGLSIVGGFLVGVLLVTEP